MARDIEMMDITKFLSIDQYNQLLDSYNETIVNINKSPTIRRAGTFYDFVETLLEEVLVDGNIKYYIIRDVRNKLKFLLSVYDPQYFRLLEITNNILDGKLNLRFNEIENFSCYLSSRIFILTSLMLLIV